MGNLRLGILGGTFDPIHTGHLLIAEAARDALRLRRVLFAPVGQPPHKQAQQSTATVHRSQMVRLAIADNPAFEFSAVDLERAGPHYSIDTVRLLREQHGVTADNCFFIIGSDSLADLLSWRNPQRLLALCRLAVVHRPGYQPNIEHLSAALPNLPRRLEWVESATLALSATGIRERLAVGCSIRYLTPEVVRDYIVRHRLYGRV